MNEKTTVVNLATIIADGRFILGKCGGLEEGAYLVRCRSGVLFRKGKDKEANIYRDLADELDELAKKKEDMYRKEYKDACDKAFDVLEKCFGSVDLSEKTEKED